MYFIKELHRRNPVMFWYSLLNFFAAFICLILVQTTSIMVNRINAYIKPFKFFLSIGTFCATMGWIMFYLDLPGKVRAYNLMAVIVLFYETFVITWQASNGRLSHFNESTVLYLVLYNLMGLAIVVLTLWTAYICFLFFRKKDWSISRTYLWGIRLGLLCFVVFALEGGVMGSMLRHTIGGSDSGEGLPLVNWNKSHGDLRIAHFLGMHALQAFPLFGYYLASTKTSVFAFAGLYTSIVIAILIQALMGLPLI